MRQWKAGGRSLEEMIIFMTQIDKEKMGREFRETTEAVAEKRQWKAGRRSLEDMIIFMKQMDKEKIGRGIRETTEAVAETEVAR